MALPHEVATCSILVPFERVERKVTMSFILLWLRHCLISCILEQLCGWEKIFDICRYDYEYEGVWTISRRSTTRHSVRGRVAKEMSPVQVWTEACVTVT